MNFIKLLPVQLSCLLIAAHFLHAGFPIVFLGCLGIPFLLFFPAKGVARFMQLFLVLASLEWIRTTVNLVQIRMAAGDDWMRLALILGGVALFTAASAGVFFAKSLKVFYHLNEVSSDE